MSGSLNSQSLIVYTYVDPLLLLQFERFTEKKSHRAAHNLRAGNCVIPLGMQTLVPYFENNVAFALIIYKCDTTTELGSSGTF